MFNLPKDLSKNLPRPDEIRKRSNRLLGDARRTIERERETARKALQKARRDVHTAGTEGRYRLFNFQADTLERARDVLDRAPDGLKPVVKPLQHAVDHQIEVAERLPVEGYDEMNARTAVDSIRGRDPVSLARIARHERSNRNRKTVIEAIDRELRR